MHKVIEEIMIKIYYYNTIMIKLITQYQCNTKYYVSLLYDIYNDKLYNLYI